MEALRHPGESDAEFYPRIRQEDRVRIQKLQEQQRVQQNKDTMELLKNRYEFFTAQIQQFQENPQIGRALSTKTFQKQTAPELATLPPQ